MNVRKAFPHAKKSDLDKYEAHIIETMRRFDISTPARQSMFLAQLAHESGSLKYVQELASGDDYDTRVDLGNTPQKDGDGRKWKGHGLIQITGFTNHSKVARYFGIPIDKIVEWLLTPEGAALSAGWFWAEFKGLNKIADADTVEAYLQVSVKINGRNKTTGLPNHWKERQDRWAEAKKAA